jgi:hypothetical protein
MRQILIDHARSRQAVKRRGHYGHLSLDGELIVSRERDVDLVALDEALSVWPLSTRGRRAWSRCGSSVG